MARAVALNVGANTNDPGFRGPVFADGSFTFVPIPETEETSADPPTYADLDLDLPFDLPSETARRPVHLDPEFAGYPCADRYTYGDPWGVKARPLLDLDAGDYLFFYATLDLYADRPSRRDPEDTKIRGGDDTESSDAAPAPWLTPEWGAYLIGHFRLARDPIPGEDVGSLSPDDRDAIHTNAHLRRDPMDAAVLVVGDDNSRLYDRVAPLSGERGVDANRVVTELSEDSGAGPWWRRPLRFDADATEELLAYVARDRYPAVR